MSVLPAPGTSPWGWLNSLSAGLALAVGIAAAGLLVGLWVRFRYPELHRAA